VSESTRWSDSSSAALAACLWSTAELVVAAQRAAAVQWTLLLGAVVSELTSKSSVVCSNSGTHEGVPL
jgi:hypothetical protein